MIKTWGERCVEHPDHQTGMVSYAMIQARMQEEIDELRAAAQEALGVLERYQVKRQDFDRFADEIVKLRAALAQPEQTRSQQMRDAGYTRRPRQLPKEDEQEPYPLPESLYPDSKDWVASDYAGRVEWLHFMYESKTREVERLETTLLRAALAQPEQLVVGGDDLPTLTKWIPQRKPLTESEIVIALRDAGYSIITHDETSKALQITLAIEKAHGIR